MSGRLSHSEDGVTAPGVGVNVAKHRVRFVDKLRDCAMWLLGQPPWGRTSEQILRPSSPSSGFHVQGQLTPGGVSSTHCPTAVSPCPLWLTTPQPSKACFHVGVLLRTGASRGVRSLCCLFAVTSPGPGTQLAPNKYSLFGWMTAGWLSWLNGSVGGQLGGWMFGWKDG